MSRDMRRYCPKCGMDVKYFIKPLTGTTLYRLHCKRCMTWLRKGNMWLKN